jgi:hypothetical protein
MLSLLGLLSVAIGLVNAIPTVSVKGSKFFTSDGKQFFVKGMFTHLTPISRCETATNICTQVFHINWFRLTLLSTTISARPTLLS